jgi:hypothetical protein
MALSVVEDEGPSASGNADKWNLKVLLREQEKWSQLQLQSATLRKRLYIPAPTVCVCARTHKPQQNCTASCALLDAPTALAACCGFDLCHKYILCLCFFCVCACARQDPVGNPFCAGRQLLDLYELRQLNRNPRAYRESLARTTEGRRMYASSGLHTSSPRGYLDAHPKAAAGALVADVRHAAAAPLAALRAGGGADAVDAGGDDEFGGDESRLPRRRRRRQRAAAAGASPGSRATAAVALDASNTGTFGHRRGSASRHMDALTLTTNREALRRGGAPPPLPRATDGGGGARGVAGGLLGAEDLARVLRGDVEASAALAARSGSLTAKELFDRAVALGDRNNLAARAGAAGSLPAHWAPPAGGGDPAESPRSVHAVPIPALEPSGNSLDAVAFSVQAQAYAARMQVCARWVACARECECVCLFWFRRLCVCALCELRYRGLPCRCG